jgi:hypothetical protein
MASIGREQTFGSDPHPVIRAVYIASELQTFIHVRSAGRSASISVGRTVVSCPEKDGEMGPSLFWLVGSVPLP